MWLCGVAGGAMRGCRTHVVVDAVERATGLEDLPRSVVDQVVGPIWGTTAQQHPVQFVQIMPATHNTPHAVDDGVRREA